MPRLNKNPFSRTHHVKPLLLQDIIKPLYIVTTVFGLIPYSVRFDKSKHSFIIIRNSIYANLLCSATICLVIFLFLILHIKEVLLVNDSGNLTEAILTQMDYIVELVALIFFCVTTYVCAFLNRINYVNLLNQIVSTWYDLPLNANSKQTLKNLRFQVNFVCLGILFGVLVLQFVVNLTRESSWWKMTLVALTFNLPQMIQFVTIAFFYILVRMVCLLMGTINSNCLHLTKYDIHVQDAFLKAHRPSLTLRQMERIYAMAFEIKTKINEAFQAPILITAMQSFHAMVSEAHIIYHGLIVQNSITTHEIVNCSIWIMYQILKIYSIAYSGNILKQEALKIGQILHRIPTEIHDDRWLMEVQHFSMLIYYQNIELTVYGYFPLNSTLIYNTLTSATMYLIILVQIDKRD